MQTQALRFGTPCAYARGMATTYKKNTGGSMTQGGKWIRPEKRLAIYLRDEFRCVYCGKIMCHVSDPRELTLDHVVCRSAGGKNIESNLITACRSCNSERGARKISEWADTSTQKTIRRNTRRSLAKYVKLAKSILASK